MPGYNVLRKDRQTATAGGGVCLYIREDLAFNPRPDLDNINLETVFIDLLLTKTKPILVGCCYRPPNQTDFVDNLQDLLSKIPSDSENFILGDFNIDMNSNRNCPLLKKYNSLLKSCGLYQIIDKPTRITESKSSLLDHILVSYRNKIIKSGVITTGYSDHSLVFCTRKIIRECINKQNLVNIRSLKHYTVPALYCTCTC